MRFTRHLDTAFIEGSRSRVNKHLTPQMVAELEAIIQDARSIETILRREIDDDQPLILTSGALYTVANDVVDDIRKPLLRLQKMIAKGRATRTPEALDEMADHAQRGRAIT